MRPLSFKLLATLAALLLFFETASPANAALSLVQDTQPSGTTSLISAIGTLNFGNNKARLEGSGFATVQGGNPGNGWWGDGTPTTPGTTPVRSWEVDWNNTSHLVTFTVFSSSDWTGAAAMTMTATPAFTGSNTLLGLDIGARLTSTSMSVTLDNVAFDDGSGFVAVSTAEATYSGSAFFNNYHSLVGTLGDFALRGTALFPTGTTTGDSMRFFVDARQGAAPLAAVPEPTSLVVWSLLAVTLGGAGWWRRRKSAA